MTARGFSMSHILKVQTDLKKWAKQEEQSMFALSVLNSGLQQTLPWL